MEVRPLGDRIASTARCGSPSRQRASAATATPRVSRAMRWTASKSPGEAAGKPASMTSTLRRTSWRATSSFSAAVSPAPGRLLAVAQRGVEDADAARGGRGCRCGRRYGGRAGPGHAASRPAQAGRPPAPASAPRRHACPPTPAPGPGVDLDRVEPRHLERSSAPTCSIWWLRSASRIWLKRGRPASFSAIQRLRERAALDLAQDVLHGRLDALDDARPGDVVAVLGRVADAEAHEVEAAAVHQVDDELELVHRLEVRQLRLVAGLDQRLEGRLDQRRHAAAEQRLLAEEVGLGLLLEGRLEHAGAGRADAAGIGQDARRPSPRRRGGRRTAPAPAAGDVHASGPGGRGPSARPSRRRPRPAGR